MLRFLTAGESHGQALVATVDGLPAGLSLSSEAIDRQLRRRQAGHGRGRRMAIESDAVEILSGVRRGVTLGSPVALLIRNKDWVNWEWTMAVEASPPESARGARRAPVTRPRPGHADLAGAIKYGHRDDLRNVLERASARETAARVAAGTCARVLLERLGIRIASHVTAIGPVTAPRDSAPSFDRIAAVDEDAVRCADPALSARMVAAIDEAKAVGDTLGGTFEVVATGLPAGLGSYAQWDRRLDARLAFALMSVPAVKAVEIGDGVAAAAWPGSQVHDAILPAVDPERPFRPARPTNRAGGLEGGMTNGEDLRITGYLKPIATLMTPLPSIDLVTGLPADAAIERSDTCAVPAAGVIGEAVVAFVLAEALLESFGGDSVEAVASNLGQWQRAQRDRFRPADRPAGGSDASSR